MYFFISGAFSFVHCLNDHFQKFLGTKEMSYFIQAQVISCKSSRVDIYRYCRGCER